MFFKVIIVDTLYAIQRQQKLKALSEISEKYDVFFIDLWGVMHNGVRVSIRNALKVLEKLKEQNKKIVLISNAPRPAAR